MAVSGSKSGTKTGTSVHRLESELQRCNEKLRAFRPVVKIFEKQGRWWLDARLPPRGQYDRLESRKRTRWSTERLATLQTLKEVFDLARRVQAELIEYRFDWTQWGVPVEDEETRTVQRWLELFEDHYRQTTAIKDRSWHNDYFLSFRKLPPDEIMTMDLLEAAIKTTPANTKVRRRVCMAYAALAKFAGWPRDFAEFRGNYSSTAVQPRELPSDHEIIALRDSIQKPTWQWVIGMIATYGLRPHELIGLEFEASLVRVGTKTKTGARLAYPLYPEWVEEWQLRAGQAPPKYSPYNLARWFNRNKIRPNSDANRFMTAYDLRHCYARRCVDFGWSPDHAAVAMGHSLQVHLRVYRAWIGEESYRRSYVALINRADRPEPPSIARG
ncbi:MAG: hypothetical protein DDT26_00115 [Dehalococcoidia bacterium]|nr:hypothetical protein [Chloroflexota bacterium]